MARDDGGAAATIITAFVLGALTGAAVALLVAPASGEETRRRLSDKAREGADRASEAARQGREFVNRQKDTFATAVERGREAYQQARGPGVRQARAERHCERLAGALPRRHRRIDAGHGADPGRRDHRHPADRTRGAAGAARPCGRRYGR